MGFRNHIAASKGGTSSRRAPDEVGRREPTESAPTIAESEIVFNDPVGDDDGPGGYTYPTDPAYKRGSFDLTEFRVSPDNAVGTP